MKRGLVFVLVLVITVLTGVVQNRPKFYIPESDYFGFPFYWRITNLNISTVILWDKFLIDFLVWLTISIILMLAYNRFMKKRKT